jgi:hypothetical protein
MYNRLVYARPNKDRWDRNALGKIAKLRGIIMVKKGMLALPCSNVEPQCFGACKQLLIARLHIMCRGAICWALEEARGNACGQLFVAVSHRSATQRGV